MTDYISIPEKAALILHGRRITPLLGKICCVNRPKKLSERKHSARHAAVSHVFVCIHHIANIPFRYFLFSVRCRYREASQTRGALWKKLDQHNRNMRSTADTVAEFSISQPAYWGRKSLSVKEWLPWNWVRDAEKLFTDVYSLCVRSAGLNARGADLNQGNNYCCPFCWWTP